MSCRSKSHSLNTSGLVSGMKFGGRSDASKKKLVIKPFKQQPRVPDDFESVSWIKLRDAVRAVCQKTTIDTSKEELYRLVEDLCIHKFAPSIYDKLYEECKQHIHQKVDSLSHHEGEISSFLEVVDAVWGDHCEHMATIRNIFIYLDQSYALPTSGRESIWELGVGIFRERLESNPEMEKKLITGIMVAINAERNGRTVDTQILHRVTRMLLSMGTYKVKFEAPFLRESFWYFQEEGMRMIMDVDVAVYLHHVEHRLEQAESMVTQYLDQYSRAPLMSTIEDTLLKPHIAALVSKGGPSLLEEMRLSDLKLLFLMARRVQSLKLLKDLWSVHLRTVGESYVVPQGDHGTSEKDVIESILQFQDKADTILVEAFCNHEDFKSALKSSFEHFVNINQTKVAELLARYVDRKLRGEKGVPDSDVENSLEKVLRLFRHLQGKDIFEAFYKKHLAKRLLLGKSSNTDNEKAMVAKMRMECGVDYTSKLEGMFTDIELARDIMIAYRQHCTGNSSITSEPMVVATSNARVEMDTEIHVLTTGFWPTYSVVELNLPQEISLHKEKFNDFYLNKYQGRRLAWQHIVDRCIVSAYFPRGKKELELSLLQTTVLLLFNSTQSLSYTDIRLKTRVVDDELRRVMQSLACGKPGTRVLVKTPKGREVDDTDIFNVDENFTNKLFRIKINTIQLKETVEEVQKTKEEVFRDRQYEVDAIIVRLMKARKKLTHNQLMGEIFSQLKFSATMSDIKKRIESLIERDYLERDKDDNASYNYLA